MAGDAPGGLSWESFKSTSLEVGDWIWGTAQGAFNEKATLSQIIVDAVIGMIPFVGDVTGVRDLIAVVIGLSTDPRKREDKWQWVMLVVLLFALIPVIGGIVKGVGRLLIKAIGEAAHLAAGAERAAHMAKAAQDIVAFLNRVGVGNAERWLSQLKFADHQQALLNKLDELLKVIHDILTRARKGIGSWLPAQLTAGIDRMLAGIKTLKELAPKKLVDAIKALDQHLTELQNFVRSGGETTSQALERTAQAAAKDVHRVDELMLLEGKAATRSARGGFVRNQGNKADIGTVYKHEPGFPDLTQTTETFPNGKPFYRKISTYAGQIVNRELQEGERVFRVFGPGGATHGVNIFPSNPGGFKVDQPGFWGLNKLPEGAEDWRKGSAVLDEWNRNGFIVVGTVLKDTKVPACTGVIAEQVGEKIGSQYLPGGAKQAIIQFAPDIGTKLNEVGTRVISTGAPEVIEHGGIRWEFRATGWDDVNGVYGYLSMPGPGSVQTARLGAKVVASKQEGE